MSHRTSMSRALFATVIGYLLSTAAASAACPPWTVLSNGSPADATQVMNNFYYLFQCPSFTAPVTIGGPYSASTQGALNIVGSAATAYYSDGIRFSETSGHPNSRDWLIANGGAAYGDLVFMAGASPGSNPAGNPVWYLAKNGFVGSNTASPQAALDLAGNAFYGINYDAIRLTETSQSVNSRNWLMSNGAFVYGDLSFLVSPSNGTAPTGTPVLYLQKNGYAGVNTSAPAARFDIVGTAFTTPKDIGLRFTETTPDSRARNWLIAEGVSEWGDLSFLVSTTQGADPADPATRATAMYISKSGTVGINMTSAPTQALEVNGKIKVGSLASASATTLCINAGVISSCSSSRRYKEQIKDATFGLKDVVAMRPVTFKWKGRNEQDFGLIAEEIARIDPRYATYKDGKIEGVKYPQLTAVLVNAVKELKAARDSQAAEIGRLRAQNTALLGHIKQQEVDARTFRARLGALERRIVIRTAENRAGN